MPSSASHQGHSHMHLQHEQPHLYPQQVDTNWVRHNVAAVKAELQHGSISDQARLSALQAFLTVPPPKEFAPQADPQMHPHLPDIPLQPEHPPHPTPPVAPLWKELAALERPQMSRVSRTPRSVGGGGVGGGGVGHNGPSTHTVVSPQITFIEGARQEGLQGRVAELESMVSVLSEKVAKEVAPPPQPTPPPPPPPPTDPAQMDATISLLETQLRTAGRSGNARAVTVLEGCIRALSDVSNAVHEAPPPEAQMERRLSPQRTRMAPPPPPPSLPPVVFPTEPEVFVPRDVYLGAPVEREVRPLPMMGSGGGGGGGLTTDAAAVLLESIERLAKGNQTSEAARVAYQMRHAQIPEGSSVTTGPMSDVPSGVGSVPSGLSTPVKRPSRPTSSWAAPRKQRTQEEEAKLQALQRKLSDLEKGAEATGYDSTFAAVQKQLHAAGGSKKSTSQWSRGKVCSMGVLKRENFNLWADLGVSEWFVAIA